MPPTYTVPVGPTAMGLPSSCPLPALHLSPETAVQTSFSASVAPGVLSFVSFTSPPNISSNVPSGPNFCTRLLRLSKTYTSPTDVSSGSPVALSTATPSGKSNWPAPEPEIPPEHVVVHVCSASVLPSATPQPHASKNWPSF